MPGGFLALVEQGGYLDQISYDPEPSAPRIGRSVAGTGQNEVGTRGISPQYSEASELARPAFDGC